VSRAGKRSEKIRERKAIFHAITRNTIAAFQLRDQVPIALIFPHVMIPLASNKAILSQPRAMIIASRLHYSLFFTEIDNIK
jgi:hypothetical protein